MLTQRSITSVMGTLFPHLLNIRRDGEVHMTSSQFLFQAIKEIDITIILDSKQT